MVMANDSVVSTFYVWLLYFTKWTWNGSLLCTRRNPSQLNRFFHARIAVSGSFVDMFIVFSSEWWLLSTTGLVGLRVAYGFIPHTHTHTIYFRPVRFSSKPSGSRFFNLSGTINIHSPRGRSRRKQSTNETVGKFTYNYCLVSRIKQKVCPREAQR